MNAKTGNLKRRATVRRFDFRPTSIKAKLTLLTMLTSGVALLVSVTLFGFNDVRTFRSTIERDLQSLADVIGASAISALDFDDEVAANKTLAPLEHKPGILAAAIYTKDDKVLASYFRHGQPATSRLPTREADGYSYTNAQLLVSQPIQRGAERLGTIFFQVDMSQIHALIMRYATVGTGILVGALLIAFVLSSRLQRVISKPILELAQTARVVSEQKNYSVRAVKHSEDEIGFLIDRFNEMLDQTEKHEKELIDLNAQHRQSRQEALAASEAKSHFLANMSHELRTPLNAIIGFSDVLLETMFGPLNEKQEEYINDIMSSGKHLLSLINDILDLSKVEAGKMELEPSVFDLRQVLDGSLVMVKERALNHGISLAAVIGEGISTVYADERKIKQILFNLLSNAVKFTPDNGAVRITAAIVGHEIQIAVSDTGVGISESDQGKIFVEFHQVSSGLTAKAEGTGLGLTLCKRFAELHSGRIWVKSSPGNGSTFTIALPREKLQCGTAAPALPQTQPPQARDDRTTDAREVQVLIIESDLSATELLAGHLKDAGYSVETAKNDVEGWEKVKRFSPGAIVVDVLHPKANGWSFLNQLKEDPATKGVPVIRVFVPDPQSKPKLPGEADSLATTVDPAVVVAKLSALGLQPQNASVRILAIDDDPRAIELLAASLEPVGFEVLRAGSGEEGVEMAALRRPDLIILDLLMPGMSGFEVIEKLEQTPLTQKPPIIIFTIKHLSLQEKQRLKGRVAGVAEKGAFNTDAFVSIVAKVLQHSQRTKNGYV